MKKIILFFLTAAAILSLGACTAQPAFSQTPSSSSAASASASSAALASGPDWQPGNYPYVKCGTLSLTCQKGETYQLQFTVYGTHEKPAVTFGTKNAVQFGSLIQAKDSNGYDTYTLTMKAVGDAGTGIYTTLPGQLANRQCLVDVIGKTIPYQNLYAGFVGEEKNFLPMGDVLIQSQSDWDTFREKYLQMSPDFDYRNIPDPDFSEYAILYHMEFTAGKEDIYLYARPVKQVVLEDGKPTLQEGDFPDNFQISTRAYNNSHYVILVLVKKADLAP